MAISKILHMKDEGSFHGRHLKQAIDYILRPEKTQQGRLVGAVNCQAPFAFEQMRRTKQRLGKETGRQGYHIIISFEEGEVSPALAFEFARRFVDDYLAVRFEAVYAVHDNTAHPHIHIIFNSVSFMDGYKYRYTKGDWARQIQPITNRLCEEFGLSTITITEENGRDRLEEKDEVVTPRREPWSAMIRRDLDACILQAASFEGFVGLLEQKGYELKTGGAYLAIRPPGMQRFRRCKTLGENYTEERIRVRIATETYLGRGGQSRQVRIVPGPVKPFRKRRLTGLQKKHFAKLYATGKLRKRAYSQAWKYRPQLRRFKELQKEYLFLSHNDITTLEQLQAKEHQLDELRREAGRQRRKAYKDRAACGELFELADELASVREGAKFYLKGEEIFAEEYERWERANGRLGELGYSLEEVEQLREHFKELCARKNVDFKELSKEAGLAKRLVAEYESKEALEVELEYERGEVLRARQEGEQEVEQEKNVSRDRGDEMDTNLTIEKGVIVHGR